jgi:hypothetical protein
LLQLPTRLPAPPVPTVPGAPETATAAALATGGATAPQSAGETPAPAATATIAVGEDNVTAVRVDTAPILDGNLGEWEGIPATTSSHRVYNIAGWDGSADLTAVWRLAWDGSNLFVAAAVADDTHVQIETGSQMFKGDSLEMQIDTNPGAHARRVNRNTYQVILSPGNLDDLPPSAFRFQGTAEGRIVDAPGHLIEVAAQETADGYTLEAAIPWRSLSVTPEEGMVLGLALNANDNDTPGTAVQEVMMSHVATRTLTDPSTWGTLTLE